MSREEGEGSSKTAAQITSKTTDTTITGDPTSEQSQHVDESPTATLPQSAAEPPTPGGDDGPAVAVKKDEPSSDSTTPSTPEQQAQPRQVIAVSASKGPAAFFNLSRKFLVTDESCDLSALEGAIVTAVDAANLLERSQLAKIVRYVNRSRRL